MIPLIDGFKINSELSIDSKIVASGSTERDLINYKYDGLKVFQLNNRLTYVWNKSRYLTSGITSSSWDLGESSLSGNGIFNHLSEWDSTGLGLTNISIISSPISFNEVNQKVGLSIDSYEAFQVNSNYLTSSNYTIITGTTSHGFGTSSMPFVIHKGVNTIIGDNWYHEISTSKDKVFDDNFASSTLSFKDGGIEFRGRTAGTSATMSSLLSIRNSGDFITKISLGATSGIPLVDGSLYYDSSRMKVRDNNKFKYISSTSSVYTSILTQIGVGIPSESLLESTVGSGTWSYISVGNYLLTTNGFISANKISGFCGPYTSTGVFYGSKITGNTYLIVTLDIEGGVYTNGLLSNTFIEIK